MATETETVNIEEKDENESNGENTKNGDTNAAITLKLPTKKSEAKTEKNVEIVKNTLPDGSVQEVKTTTTTVTIDGRTEITTETETTTFPKDCGDDVEYEVEVEDDEEVEEEEEEEEISEEEVVRKTEPTCEIVSKTIDSNDTTELNSKNDSEKVKENQPLNNDVQLITEHESHESSTTKKVVIIQSSETQDSDVEDEENRDDVNKSGDVDKEPIVVLKTTTDNEETGDKTTELSSEIKRENDLINNDGALDTVSNNQEEIEDNDDEYEEIEEEEEAADNSQEVINKEETCPAELNQNDEEVEEEYEEAEESEDKEQITSIRGEEIKLTESKKDEEPLNVNQEINNDTNESDVKTIPVQVLTEKKDESEKEQKEYKKPESQPLPASINIPLIEPVVPLDKVEEVEIKPIGPANEIITKTHTEITTTTSGKPVGSHSTQTEYNVVQNIVTVNRTIKTLDHAYEEIPDNIPTIKTFVPPSLEGNFLTSQPAFKPSQASFTPEPQIERRHSLLLERLSVERQMPPEIYQNHTQNSNQTWEETKYSQEPQSEILTVSNVKPSMISKNQQWYQRNEMENRSTTLQSTDSLNNNQTQPQNIPQVHSFYQPKSQPQPPTQTIYQRHVRVQPSPQPLYKPSNPVQNISQPSYHSQQQSKSTYQSQPASQRLPQIQPPEPVQPIYHPQPQYQQNYIDNTCEETYKSSTNKYEHSAYPSYTSKPIWAGNSLDSQPLSSTLSNQSYHQKNSTESFEQSHKQQLSSSYVPPPWEQDPNYVVNNTTSSFYQPTPSKTALPTNTDWLPPKPSPKFSKTTPTSYIPPAPNQSFVKPVNTSETPRQQGRKTYYSEYERRYISVPEATYIPNETKLQPQPDPSPQYYYDKNEPVEVVEPQWRKELREFKEQSSKTTVQTELTTVRPPWEDDPKYATPSQHFTPTPTWTQTLKPRSYRERSFEPEYIGSQEWPKTNTLGRGRPQSSYTKNTVDRVPDRTRGVSVDRYNPNNYQSPMTREHPPPASHILDPIVQGKTYHNPNVPAYHSRASVEPREQPVTYQQPRHRESRAAPVQSRSFKYLQWITGTDD
ncbi:stress response protein NST1 isoform X2 [Pieris rapae]|uniref:stress response protein NST1 isoform X2 n=1 Tax=Pieris rapae TaxID=64459 RepID=UPI001E2813CB|nr:stress response protein NST1 isoform X2 [Pieris rapae]XP_022116816.2 stress response protein NST1 isoform X2 [Pieris rapae]